MALGLAPRALAGDPSEMLEGLSGDERAWVERSCPRSWGPATWAGCVRRNVGAIREGLPEISGLSQENQQWILSSCPRSWGPQTWSGCVRRNLASFKSSYSPARTSPAHAATTSPESLEPALLTDENRYVLCVQIALALLGYDIGGPDGVFGPKTRTAIRAFERDRAGSPDALTELAERAASIDSLGRSAWKQASEDDVRVFREALRVAAGATTVPPTSTPPSATASSRPPSAYSPPVAENGDVMGMDNDGDGRTEPIHVRGYYRKDGTYVRGHYRARPRRRR